ncbi:triphosphoribosyl-dephospho-CoA synthase [Halosegnis marinus]|uniref:Triphosphoribosyl-dephospho-CoA synthase n=1 Tax=Halosegnis marinus TaxID=3034023 RepID=A0ABD5ZK87_9EURY|nr:triphosphoribosyl-dephospho-CoA synthase [Halosegnis sp. DT85]
MRTHAENAELALLLEVAGTPKPGNVDRARDHEDLRFEHFLAGAVGSAAGLRAAESGAPVGEAFEAAVAGMSDQRGGNTQFGCLLLLVPLVRAAAAGDLSEEGVRAVCDATTTADAAGFYRAFEHVDVAVADPPEGTNALDVRRGADAVPELEARGLTLADVMARSEGDGNAREWREGFPRTFREAERILDDDGPAPDRGARAFLRLLAEREDGFVRTTSGPEAAREARERARACLDGEEDPETLAGEFVERGINPGTTADITCAALYVALERGLAV